MVVYSTYYVDSSPLGGYFLIYIVMYCISLRHSPSLFERNVGK